MSPPATIQDRLLRDVVGTVGEQHRAAVLHRAAELRTLDLDHPDSKLVDDIQQYLHDIFADVQWPACPRHASHPLWYHDEAWWCEQDAIEVARLGELTRQ